MPGGWRLSDEQSVRSGAAFLGATTRTRVGLSPVKAGTEERTAPPANRIHHWSVAAGISVQKLIVEPLTAMPVFPIFDFARVGIWMCVQYAAVHGRNCRGNRITALCFRRQSRPAAWSRCCRHNHPVPVINRARRRQRLPDPIPASHRKRTPYSVMGGDLVAAAQ